MDIKDVKRGRPALDPALILSELAKTSSKWLDIKVFAQVESTNDLVIAQFSNYSNDSVFAITADEQIKGRGRLQREWQSPFGAGVALSVAIPTKSFKCEISAIPLLVGIAANNCLTALGANAKLKWPNDLMLASETKELKKVGGILVQREGTHVVVGIGINTDLKEDELPTEVATSLALVGIHANRESLIAGLLVELERITHLDSGQWLPLYAQASSTIGTEVSVARTVDSVVTGKVTNVLATGELVLQTEQGIVEVSSGDVLQVRPTLP